MDRGSIKPGTEVYTIKGQRALYRAATENGHIIEPLMAFYGYEDGEDFGPSGQLVEVARVFTSEPEEAYGSLTKHAQAQLKFLDGQIAEAHEQLRMLEGSIGKHENVRMVLDFLEGRITHFAITKGYKIGVHTFDEHMRIEEGTDYDSKVRFRGMRLLTLYGTQSEADKRFTYWSSSNPHRSFSGLYEAIPCRSEEEAKGYVLDEFNRHMNAWTKSKGSRRHELLDFERAHGIELPWTQEWLDMRAKEKAEKRVAEIEKLKNKIEADQKRLKELEAEGE